MQFNRLRLSGFKSFVDPTELRVEPGLTGIVGPNGCGKSNLVEALRWAMGETSPRSMRGSGMDDVIFAGTDRRPARNLAEVSILLDNGQRKAPAAFNDADMLEVTRRIEREAGSAWRINGRDVRAKDVQLLFADAATGAHSPSQVSQGRVGALIAARPQDRRALLEEAAGIGGLNSRRKEAEQRLRAAEANLLRLADVVTQYEGQIAALKRQARQAERYRGLSGEIRKIEAAILLARWQAAAAEAVAVEAEFAEAGRAAGRQTGELAALETARTDLAAALPDARRKEAGAAAVLQRLVLARDSLEGEEKRRREALERLAALVGQIAADETRERESREDAAAALARLATEQERLAGADAGERERRAVAKDALAAAQAAAAEAEARFDEASQKLAESRGRKASMLGDLATLRRRRDRLALDLEDTRRALAGLAGVDDPALAVERHEREAAQREAALAGLDDRIAAAEAVTATAREAVETARDTRSARRAALAAAEADIAALDKRLAASRKTGSTTIADSLGVEAGYEAALAAALGDDLEASEDADAALRWTVLAPLDDCPPPPPGTSALADRVKVPPALARRLAFTALLDDGQDAENLDAGVAALVPGQRLVSREGALWRWDGLVRSAGAPSAAARRLEQKNRLSALGAEAASLRGKLAEAGEALEAAEQAFARAREAENAMHGERNAVDAGLRGARKALAEAEAEAGRRASRRAGLEETSTRLEREVEEAGKAASGLEERVAALPDPAAMEAALEELRREVTARRAALAEARAGHESIEREAAARRERCQAIASERQAWSERVGRADSQLARLAERREAAEAESAVLDVSPEEIESRRHALADGIAEAESARRAAADALAEAETALAAKDRELADAREGLAAIRERRARAEVALEGARRRKQELEAHCGERFRCPPPLLAGEFGIADRGAPAPVEAMETHLERLRADRERLGAVNLRAAKELAEIEGDLARLVAEREDLEGAIRRLRQAIRSLNGEGRARLLAAFAEVNRHFGELFASLFGGGHARLELVDSEDPLEAGIEILASPPGKRLQLLSLLSGGEQALTALSLIFAVFMTNPAPICVLDEVDAPLDEANVERFCDLLDRMVADTATRFLIVTHNEVTMARMHRLFGVTMGERGISQLVSVDLQRAGTLIAAE